jgi:putative transposase
VPSARHHRTDLVSLEAEFGDRPVPEARRLKALEEANRRLKRLVADQSLNLQVLKDVAGKDW